MNLLRAIAQLVEHKIDNQKVPSSIPGCGQNFKNIKKFAEIAINRTDIFYISPPV